MKGVAAFFKKWSKNIIVSLICTFMLCAGIGYAQITRPLNITGNIDVAAQEGIFIIQAGYVAGSGTSASYNYVNQCYSTVLNANVQLSETAKDSYAEFDVTIYNKYTVPYRYAETLKISGYSNDNIDFEVLDSTGANVLAKGVEINPSEYLNIKIRFKYASNADMTATNHHILNACVNFNFNVYVKPVLADNMVPVAYNQGANTWSRVNEDSFGYADYDSGVWANAITYDHSKAYSQNEYTTNGGTIFNGQTNYINYRHENVNFGNSITVGARFKWAVMDEGGTLGDGSLGYMICNLESAGFGLFVVHGPADGSPQEYGQVGFRFITSSGTQTVYSTSKIEQYEWVSVIATYDGQNVNIYINGVLDKTEAATGDILPSAAAINVGNNPRPYSGIHSTSEAPSSDGFHFEGAISHVMVLKNALSGDVVKKVHDTRFRHSTKEYNQLLNLDITSRDSNGKYFDGYGDGGYNLDKQGYTGFNTNNLAKFSIATSFCLLSLNSSKAYLICNMQTYGFGFGFEKAKGGLHFAFYNENISDFVYASATQAVDFNRWYNAVVTVDGYNIRMYLDGVEQQLTFTTGKGTAYTPGTTALKLKNSSVWMAMGGNPDANGKLTGDMYNGWIKDCVVFKKTLSQAEIIRDFSDDFAFHYKNYSTSNSSTDVVQYVKYDYDNIILNTQQSYTEEGIVLDGKRDYICVGLGNHNFDSSLTIAIRLKFPVLPNARKALVSNYEEAGFQLDITADNHFNFYAKHNNLSGTANITASNITIQANTWYTVVCLITKGGIHLYVNGALQASTTGSFNLKNCVQPIFIGANPNEGSYSGMSNIIVSDYAFINESLPSELIPEYFSGQISARLVRANCFLNFVGFEYREDNHSIPEEMITGHYTWIPRFKVKSTLESGEVDIEIVTTASEAHDAFTFNGVELEGFWFSKFENSIDNKGQVQSIANANVYTTDTISQMFNSIKQIETGNSGFNTNDYAMLNIHMSKNSEWGAMAYFAQSKYGLFRTGNLATIQANNTSIAGNSYEVNTNQSTTQNVTGIYDIVGGANEYVMANYNETIGSSGFTTLPDSYYYNVYTTFNSYYNSNLYHAMGEVDFRAYQPNNSTFVTSSNPWLVRTGLFDYSAADGSAGYSSRTVIAIVK